MVKRSRAPSDIDASKRTDSARTGTAAHKKKTGDRPRRAASGDGATVLERAKARAHARDPEVGPTYGKNGTGASGGDSSCASSSDADEYEEDGIEDDERPLADRENFARLAPVDESDLDSSYSDSEVSDAVKLRKKNAATVAEAQTIKFAPSEQSSAPRDGKAPAASKGGKLRFEVADDVKLINLMIVNPPRGLTHIHASYWDPIVAQMKEMEEVDWRREALTIDFVRTRFRLLLKAHKTRAWKKVRASGTVVQNDERSNLFAALVQKAEDRLESHKKLHHANKAIIQQKDRLLSVAAVGGLLNNPATVAARLNVAPLANQVGRDDQEARRLAEHAVERRAELQRGRRAQEAERSARTEQAALARDERFVNLLRGSLSEFVRESAALQPAPAPQAAAAGDASAVAVPDLVSVLGKLNDKLDVLDRLGARMDAVGAGLGRLEAVVGELGGAVTGLSRQAEQQVASTGTAKRK